LDQVEIGLLGQPERVVDGNNANLLASGPDEPHLGYPDALVDTWFGADVTSSVTLFSVPGRSRHRSCLVPPGQKQKAPHALPAGPPRAGTRSPVDRTGLAPATHRLARERADASTPGLVSWPCG